MWCYEKRLASTVQSGCTETHLTGSVNAGGYNITSKKFRQKTCEMSRCKCGVRHFYSWCKCTIQHSCTCYWTALFFTVISTDPEHVSTYSHISPHPHYQSDSQQFMHAKDKWSDFLFPFTCPNPLGLLSIFHFLHRKKKINWRTNAAESPSVSERAWLLRFITLEQPRHLALLCTVFFLIVNEPLNLSALSPTCTSMTANRPTVNLLGERI